MSERLTKKLRRTEEFKDWYLKNRNELKELYDVLWNICENYDIELYNNDETFENFLHMIYYETKSE